MLTLDHLVILVSNLDQAIADYSVLGFTVTPGGAHADGLTHNALIAFDDATYLELIAFLDPTDSRDNVWGWRHLSPAGGLIDYCMASTDLVGETERLRRLGFAVRGPTDGGRQRPDGTELRWRSASFDQPHRVYPFLIEDVTPRSLRVPDSATKHANGACGISELVIAVRDLYAEAERWQTIVPASGAATGEDGFLDADTMTFHLTSSIVRLAAPRTDRSPLHGYAPGPFAVVLAGDQSQLGGWLDRNRTHGARIRLERHVQLRNAARHD